MGERERGGEGRKEAVDKGRREEGEITPNGRKGSGGKGAIDA
jgi:hypothetical protein